MHGIESYFKCLTIPSKQVQDRSKEFIQNKNNNNNKNNNKKISWGNHWSR